MDGAAQQHERTRVVKTAAATTLRNNICMAWFLLGLVNNTPYVIMLATAKYMSEGGTALVYLVNTTPGLLVKLSAPFWFDRVSYRRRLGVAATCMAMAFVTTSYYCREQEQETTHRMMGQLLGVALVSVQIGMGEASLLALAGKMDTTVAAASAFGDNHNKKYSLLAFSSGTGLAGPTGYLWKIALSEWVGLGVSQTLLLGVVLVLIYWRCFLWALVVEKDFAADDDDDSSSRTVEQELQPLDPERLGRNTQQRTHRDTDSVAEMERVTDNPHALMTTLEVADMTVRERSHLVLSLWPYIVPLFTVYAAEYACQAGVWSAIGFPTVDSVEGRTHFYERSNWLYQAGNFGARSAGAFFSINMAGLWVIPVLQLSNLIWFTIVAARHGFFYRKRLLYTASFYTGLLGGSCYVHGYTSIARNLPKQHTEFALSTTCVAEAFGVLVADILGLFLQSCLYDRNNLPGAMVKCPL